ncbi:MAG: hypothetical protein JOY77_00320 [Alphaproteobacteria bacterium]|nr:hypothetical protein [Alphaproteobacteria bacterium]MBV9061358.1 hypothetical protein [Alphaproteobacteria bacterium]
MPAPDMLSPAIPVSLLRATLLNTVTELSAAGNCFLTAGALQGVVLTEALCPVVWQVSQMTAMPPAVPLMDLCLG